MGMFYYHVTTIMWFKVEHMIKRDMMGFAFDCDETDDEEKATAPWDTNPDDVF